MITAKTLCTYDKSGSSGKKENSSESKAVEPAIILLFDRRSSTNELPFMAGMEEIARYGAEDVCSSRDSPPLAVPNRPVGANLAVSKSLPFPIPLLINK